MEGLCHAKELLYLPYRQSEVAEGFKAGEVTCALLIDNIVEDGYKETTLGVGRLAGRLLFWFM